MYENVSLFWKFYCACFLLTESMPEPPHTRLTRTFFVFNF
jgi:hypothetical protein